MKRDEWAYLGFGFGTAVVLGLAAWGAIELTKKIVAKHKEKACSCGCEDDESEECECGDDECCDSCDEECCEGECCEDDSCGDGCCGDNCCETADGNDSSKESGDDIVEKSVNAQDEVLSSEFGSKSES